MYGDGIVVPQAQAFIEAYCAARGVTFPEIAVPRQTEVSA